MNNAVAGNSNNEIKGNGCRKLDRRMEVGVMNSDRKDSMT